MRIFVASPARGVFRERLHNLNERARQVLMLARENALKIGHEYIATEHLLLGLIDEPEGLAAAALQNLSAGLQFRLAGKLKP